MNVHYVADFLIFRCFYPVFDILDKKLIEKNVCTHKKSENMIKRDTYLNELIKARNNGFAKAIAGIRRCGNSYLLNIIYKNYFLYWLIFWSIYCL